MSEQPMAAAPELARLEASPTECHGWRGDVSWAAPVRTHTDEAPSRPGYNSKPRHEYHDEEDVLRAKVALLAQMLRDGKHIVAYTGAGISTGAGIKDYASAHKNGPSAQEVRAQRTSPRLAAANPGEDTRVRLPARPPNPWDAAPTPVHRVLAGLHRRGHLQTWIQQNHDGLPQKAGVPQTAMNEIHGAWYDVGNPVVQMKQNLRSDLFRWLLEEEQAADLVLALGTSMCGMNADRVVDTCANKALAHAKRSWRCISKNRTQSAAPLGSVIVSLQQTVQDATSALRIFANLDTVFEMLAEEFAMDPSELDGTLDFPAHDPAGEPEDVFALPQEDGTTKMLDLREGAAFRVLAGPHRGCLGEVMGKNRGGHYRLRYKVGTKWATAVLGKWWPVEAARGDFLGRRTLLGLENP